MKTLGSTATIFIAENIFKALYSAQPKDTEIEELKNNIRDL